MFLRAITLSEDPRLSYVVVFACKRKLIKSRLTDGLVTFDQNVKNAISAEFGILAASLPDWWFLRTKGVIGTFSQTVRARIF